MSDGNLATASDNSLTDIILIFYLIDASKFLSQSQARLSTPGNLSSFSRGGNDAPLFYSAAEFENSDNSDSDNDNPSDSFFSLTKKKPSSNKHKKHDSNSHSSIPSSKLLSSVYGGASTYAKTYNSPSQHTWGKSFANRSPRKTLLSSQYNINEGEDKDDESNEIENSHANYSQYSQYSNDDPEEDHVPAFLSIEDSAHENQNAASESIMFSRPLDASVSSADDTPHASLHNEDDTQHTLQSSRILRPPPHRLNAPFISGLKQSVNMTSALAGSLLSTRNTPSPMESIQLTQTLNHPRIDSVRGNKSKDSLNHPKNTLSALDQNEEDEDNDPPIDITLEMSNESYNHKGKQPSKSLKFNTNMFTRREDDVEAQHEYALESESEGDDEFSDDSPSSYTNELFPSSDLPKQDVLWGNIYLGLISIMLSTSLIIWLRTEVPLEVNPIKSPVKNTMYTMLQKSGKYLMFDTFIASLASIIWIVMLKRYSVAFFYLSIVTVPFTLIGISVYSLVMSYRTTYGGNTTQDKAMRWTTLVPFALAAFWCWFIYNGRHALNRALGIIKLASSIITDNPPLVFLGYATVGTFVIATWFWIKMFARLFLNGHATKSGTDWVLSTKTWILAAFYVFMYLWSWGVVSGFQRATISAVVSQWYFYRNASPQPSSADMTIAALQYSIGSQFGTVCFSAFLRLAIRLPLYVLPRRAVGYVQLVVYSMIPASVLALTNPLALSNAVINSQALVESAQSISSLRYLDLGHNNPMEVIDKIGRRMSVRGRRMSSVNSRLGTTEEYMGKQTQHSQTDGRENSWTAYRLSKMLLTAARGLVSLGLGYGAWIHAAMYKEGSLYGYAAGLIAGFIGWFVLGASEGVLSMTVDASFLCFAIDNAARGGHCTEADRQFGGV